MQSRSLLVISILPGKHPAELFKGINSPLYSPGADTLGEESEPGSWVFLVLPTWRLLQANFLFSANLIFMGKIAGSYIVYKNKCTLDEWEAHLQFLLTLEKHMESLFKKFSTFPILPLHSNKPCKCLKILLHKKEEERIKEWLGEEEWELLTEKPAQKIYIARDWDLKTPSGPSLMAAAADVWMFCFLVSFKKRFSVLIWPSFAFYVGGH